MLGVNIGISINTKNFTEEIWQTSNTGNNQNVYIGNINDGKGLTVEICNNGRDDVKNIQLKVDTENNKFILIPKRQYNIPSLSAHDSTEIQINLFGLRGGIFLECPVLTFIISSPVLEITQKKITVNIIGRHTKVVDQYSTSNEPFEGYTLFGPEYSRYTYLIDLDSKIIHWWKSNYIQGMGIYLLENGNLVRMSLPGVNPTFAGGGISGRVETFDKDSNLLWEFEYFNDKHCLHHDIEPLPNGNILMIAWEYKTAAEAIATGRNPNKLRGDSLWPDHIIEIKPVGSGGGDIVWEWHVWDHLIQDYDPMKNNYGVVTDHPELIDINYGTYHADWNHINSVDYNEEFDQILLSVHNFDEIWIIDHSTTTEEAAGHTGGKYGKGGDLLYRWGNPRTYRAGTPQDQKFFGQHDATWIEQGCPGEGNILVFNNGRTRRYSSVDEIVPPVDTNGNYAYIPGTAYKPDKQRWIYTAEKPTDFYSDHISGAQRLPNGNTLICNGAKGIFFEVTPEKNIVWDYVNVLPAPKTNHVFKILRYPTDYPGIPKIKHIN